jgi:sulfate permease, SulP family
MKSKLLNLFIDLKGYTIEKFKADLNAGIVTGIVAIPLSLALAIATGVPPIWGLYTGAIAGFIAAFFAGSRFSVSGPAAAMVPVLAAIIAVHGVEALPVIGVLSGIILILFGVLKLGTFIKYVPLSVTLGFTAGVAIVLFFGQLNAFLGLSGIHKEEHFHEKVLQTIEHIGTASLPTIAVGIISIAILILLPKVKRLSKIPPSLVAVIVCTTLVYFSPAFHGVKTIADQYGAIKLGFPPFHMLSFGNTVSLIGPAFQVAFLISIESLLCAVVADKMTKTRHRSNQELISQGISNIITPFFTGIPSTAVIARTGTSIKNGAQTRIAAIIHAVLVLTFLLLLAPLGSKIPLTVLSSILFITAWKISEQKEIRHLLHRAPKFDLAILFITLGLTVFLDLTIAVGVGLVLSALYVFRKVSVLHVDVIDFKDRFGHIQFEKMIEKNPDLEIVSLEGNLSMGASNSLADKVEVGESVKKIVLRMREVHYVDLSGLESLDAFIESMRGKGKQVYLSSVNKRVFKALEEFKITEKVDGVFENSNVLAKSFA